VESFFGDMVSVKPRLISDFTSGGGGVWGGILRLLHPFSFGEIRGGHHENIINRLISLCRYILQYLLIYTQQRSCGL